MDSKSLQSICNEVYRQFPEVKGSSPQIKAHGPEQQLLVFQGKVKTSDGKTLPRTVRVVVDQSGNIKKITTSR
jgi:hypothetical protein